ncbi:MAG TPA: non-canonical purine NTP pyrophosphatase [Anaeromyxobacteraceae bacterium]|nr:non-canonical purine NTP pyrophosphatase [Anaeromyxobacteraceae bacterium]
MDLFFGTRNPGKLTELRRLLARLPVRVLSPEDLPGPLPEVEEDGSTMAENARKKASAYARLTGMHALADDSGICVDVLWGLPGVRSARWSEDVAPGLSSGERDRANNQKLLGAMRGVPAEHRGAEYRAVLALAAPDGTVLATVTGTCRGVIGTEERGAGGFGYDPLFVPDAIVLGGPHLPRTMAELGPEEKDAISHRGEAMRKMLPLVRELAAAG